MSSAGAAPATRIRTAAITSVAFEDMVVSYAQDRAARPAGWRLRKTPVRGGSSPLLSIERREPDDFRILDVDEAGQRHAMARHLELTKHHGCSQQAPDSNEYNS